MPLDTIKEVRSWLTPALVLICSFLIKSKLGDIEDKMRTIDDVNARVIRNEVRIQTIESNQAKFEGQFQTHIQLMGIRNEQQNLDDILKGNK